MHIKKKALSVALCASLMLTCFTGCGREDYFDISIYSIAELTIEPKDDIRNIRDIIGNVKLEKSESKQGELRSLNMNGLIKLGDDESSIQIPKAIAHFVYDKDGCFVAWRLNFLNRDTYTWDADEFHELLEDYDMESEYTEINVDYADDLFDNISFYIKTCIGEPTEEKYYRSSIKNYVVYDTWDSGSGMYLQLIAFKQDLDDYFDIYLHYSDYVMYNSDDVMYKSS